MRSVYEQPENRSADPGDVGHGGRRHQMCLRHLSTRQVLAPAEHTLREDDVL